MTYQEIINFLLAAVSVAWFAKNFFHFKYLKLIDTGLKNIGFISFFIKVENILQSVIVIMPVFLGTRRNNEFVVIQAKSKVRISVWILWLLLFVLLSYLYYLQIVLRIDL